MTLPIVEEILRLPSHADRADWLIRCPDWHVVGSVATIRRALEQAAFPEAITYLDARHASLQAVRTSDGSLTQTVLMGLNYALLTMQAAAKDFDAVGAGGDRNRSGGPIVGGEGPRSTPIEGEKGGGK